MSSIPIVEKRGFGYFIWDCLTTVDHKKIVRMHIAGSAFIIGGLEALVIRTQLIILENDFISAGFYNEI